MPSSYDPTLRLELQAVGENASTWGTKTNNNLELLAEAIAGHVSVNVAGGAPYTLITANASTDEARHMFITFNGVLTSAIPVYVPAASKVWFIRDNTSGSFGLTVRTSTGTGVSLTRTGINVLVCDGVSVYPASEVNRVAKSGDTMTGPLALPTSTTPDDANATRADYVRTLVASVSASVAAAETHIAAVSASVSALQVQLAAVSAQVSVNAANIAVVSALVSVVQAEVTARVAKSGDLMTGALGIIAGTTAAPGIYFSGDTDTGIFSPGGNTLAAATSGTEVWRVDSGGRMMIGTTSVKPGYVSVGDITLPAGAKVYGLNLPKAWVNFNGATGAINAAFNVSGVVRNSVGNCTITFANALADANYVMNGNARGSGSAHQMLVSLPDGGTKTTTQCQINTMLANVGNLDSNEVMCTFFGN